MNVELTQEDVQSLLAIINSVQIRGSAAEDIVLLKRKLQVAIKPVTKEASRGKDK